MRHGRTARRNRLFAAAVLLLTALLPAMPSGAAPLQAVDGGEEGAISSALIKINQFRGDHGLLPLTLDRRLTQAALRHAKAMADSDFFSHIGADGSQMGGRLTETGYVWRLVAENLAAGMTDPVEAVQVWIDSPGHRHNLLMKDVIHAGFGHVRRDPDPGTLRYRDYWVLMLAAPQKGH